MMRLNGILAVRRRWLVILMMLVMPAMFAGEVAAGGDGDSSSVVDTSPQVAVDWMNLLYERVQTEKSSAPGASRIYAYAGITLYESLLGGMPDNVTLAGQIWHMPDLPLWEDDVEYDWIAVMNGTVSVVFPALFDKPSEETIAAFNELRDAQLAARAEDSSEEVIERSVAYGGEIAAAIIEWISEDGYKEATAAAADYVMPVGDGMWELTTEGTKPAGPYWGELRPFGLDNSFTCAVYPNIPYSTDENSPFYKQALEVYETERNLTDWQKETARFWVDTPGETGTPAGHWIAIVGQLPDQIGLDLVQTVMAYAMVGMAEGDSFISAWAVKYQIMLLRPVTFIQANIRQRWTPYIQTPPFPEYPSGHSVVSAAAAEVLTQMFGAQYFEDRTHMIFDHEPLTRAYTSFEAAAYEAAISRLYGGIHYRSAIENGMRQGRCIGANLMDNIRLNPVLQGE
jgi:membrane-associated phospholipid phosphatase